MSEGATSGLGRRIGKAIGRRVLQLAGRMVYAQSRIPTTEKIDAPVFDWIPTLEKNWGVIRSELESVLDASERLPAFHEISPDQARISREDHWKTYVFQVFGRRFDPNCARCPQTARLLAGIPDLQNAWFSILAPGYHIPPHRGPTNAIVRIHLGLMVPRNRDACRIRVGAQEFSWEEGRCVVFDDFYEHEVWNDTDERRVVLFFDVTRPMKPAGRPLVSALLAAMRRSRYVRDAWRNLEQREQAG